MATRRNRRRRILIDELQYRLLVVNISYFVIILAIFVSALFAPLVVRLLDPEATTFTREEVASQFLWLDESVWLPLLFTLFCLGLHSVFVSHRIAGPLYQLRGLLQTVADGNFTKRAVLRRKDYLQKEEAVVNEMIEKLGTRIEEVGEQAAALRATVDQLRVALDRGATGEALEYLQGVAESTGSLNAALSHFKTRRDASPATPEFAPANN